MTHADYLHAGECAGRLQSIFYYKADNICFPKNSTMSQHAAIVVNYIEEQPTFWHHSFFLVAELALLTAWPCKK
jgi:hypothetical protein